jgi:hypothetical protein
LVLFTPVWLSVYLLKVAAANTGNGRQSSGAYIRLVKYVTSYQIYNMSAKELTPKLLEQETENIVKRAVVLFPGETTKKKKAWCATQLYSMLEAFDNYIPVVGALLDNPFADNLEKQAVSMLVDWAWNNFIEPKDGTADTKVSHSLTSHPLDGDEYLGMGI